MLLELRAERAEDASALVDLYARAYPGGYSASFDRYGPIKGQDFWWVQSEKDVLLLEVNRRPAGLLILGRREQTLVVEEALGDLVDPAAAGGGGAPSPPGRSATSPPSRCRRWGCTGGRTGSRAPSTGRWVLPPSGSISSSKSRSDAGSCHLSVLTGSLRLRYAGRGYDAVFAP